MFYWPLHTAKEIKNFAKTKMRELFLYGDRRSFEPLYRKSISKLGARSISYDSGGSHVFAVETGGRTVKVEFAYEDSITYPMGTRGDNVKVWLEGRQRDVKKLAKIICEEAGKLEKKSWNTGE